MKIDWSQFATCVSSMLAGLFWMWSATAVLPRFNDRKLSHYRARSPCRSDTRGRASTRRFGCCASSSFRFELVSLIGAHSFQLDYAYSIAANDPDGSRKQRFQ